jgi:hypothetical protein
MGVALGDYLHTGRPSIAITHFSEQYLEVFRNDGKLTFTDVSNVSGIARATTHVVGWGDAFYDIDNDGWLDLIAVNGHVYPQVDRNPWGTSWAQRPMLFHIVGGKRFEPVPAVEGTGLADVIAGRGLAVGDLFNDGRLDVVINVMDGHPVILRNVSAYTNHWLELKLVGGPRSPRDAVGATVYVTANGTRRRDDVLSGGSYASTSDPRLHFGLGQAREIDDIEVHWPSGAIEHFTVPDVDRIVTLTEGTGNKSAKAASASS